jgi:hypothetical protein
MQSVGLASIRGPTSAADVGLNLERWLGRVNMAAAGELSSSSTMNGIINDKASSLQQQDCAAAQQEHLGTASILTLAMSIQCTTRFFKYSFGSLE